MDMKELNITEGIRILEIPKWSLAQNWLETTGRYEYECV